MDTFLIKAYLISTIVTVILLLLLSPFVLDLLFTYIGWTPYMLISIGLIFWCAIFISIGIAFNPKNKEDLK